MGKKAIFTQDMQLRHGFQEECCTFSGKYYVRLHPLELCRILRYSAAPGSNNYVENMNQDKEWLLSGF